MTRAEIQQQLVEALASVAPELDASTLETQLALRDQVDLDSMDFLRYVIELHKRLGVEIAEADYDRLATIDQAVDYVAARLAVAPREA